NAAGKEPPIRVPNDAGASNQVVPCIVIHLNVRRGRRTGRKAHSGHDRRKTPVAVRPCKSRNIKNRSENVPFAWNDCAAERGIEKIPVRDWARKDLSSSKEPVRDSVLETIRVVVQVNIVHNDSLSKALGAVHVMVVDGRLNFVTPTAEIPFQLWSYKVGAVVE